MTLQTNASSKNETMFTHWLRGRPVWMAMFATAMLSTAYTALVLVHRVPGTLPLPSHEALVFIGWAAVQCAFVALCMLKVRFERRRQDERLAALQIQQDSLAATAHEDRYRDLFGNLTEMIAVLSPAGKYLYVNAAWQRCFRRSAVELLELEGFASAFPFSIRPQAAAMFERALTGEHVDQIHLRLDDASGRTRELEANLFRQREGGLPGPVRCIFRDVTLRNQRERRLAMQLGVSQVIQEATPTEDSLTRILGALGSHLGFDLVQLWRVDAGYQVLRYASMWMGADCVFGAALSKSASSEFAPGEGLPGLVWMQGASLWVEDIHTDPRFASRDGVKTDQLATGWGVPVRVGNQIIAVVEFFSRKTRREDAELMAPVETVCASIGQFLERSAQEKRVTELNRQKESILNTVADGILGTDQHGRVTFANPAAGAMLGASANALIGRFVHAIAHEDVLGSPAACVAHCRMRRAFFTREGAQGQDLFYRADGTSFPVEFTVTPMLVQGSTTGSVLNFRDVSQRQALDRMKDEFISTVSHELRTPLTSIRGSLGLLATGLLGEMTEKASNLLRIAVNNSDRLVRLINDILDLERMQSGRAPLSFRRCAVDELVYQAIDAMTPVAEAAGVRLMVEAEALIADVDGDRLLQVITNLVSNAIKFSPPDSSVQVRLEQRSEGVALSVSDEGRGIPEDKLEFIFERFQQVDASDARQKGGTGLGLAICRTIVEQHRGRIWAERNAVRGATFHVLLNLPALEDTRLVESPRTLEQGTVLICDDDAETRFVLGNSLRHRGYNVVEASTGHEAVALSHQLKLDAILLDLTLPDMNGWQTLRTLKDQETTANVPVVVLSMYAEREGFDSVHKPDGWLRKLAGDTDLLRELARVIKHDDQSATILLIEDDRDLARVIIATFEQASIGVLHARTCEEAVQLCRAATPSLLILDLSLPDGDGFTFVQWLRSAHQLSRLPLIVYSARDVAEDERSRLRLGPTEFLTKARVQPKEIEALVRTMLHPEREALEGARQERATREDATQSITVADDFLSSTPLDIRGQWDVAY